MKSPNLMKKLEAADPKAFVEDEIDTSELTF